MTCLSGEPERRDPERAKAQGVVFYSLPSDLTDEMIDPLLRQAVRKINESGWVWTAESCQGHPDATRLSETAWDHNTEPFLRLACHEDDEGQMLALLLRSLAIPDAEALEGAEGLWNEYQQARVLRAQRGEYAEVMVYLRARTAGERNGGTPISSASRLGGKMIEEAIKDLRLLPTPNADDTRPTSQSARDQKTQTRLSETVRLLPTPVTADSRATRNKTANDGQGSTGHSGTTLSDVAYEWSGATTSRLSGDGSKSTGQRPRLSPEFVEWMQGTPTCGVCGRGWTDSDCPHSATEFTAMSPGSLENESSSLRSNG